MDKIDKHLIETVKSVVNPDTTDTDQLVLEYLDGYFGGELNESTSSDDIMAAFDELLETADAVREFMVEQGILSKAANLAKKAAKKTKKVATHPTTKKVTKKVLRKTGRVVKGAAGVALDMTQTGMQSARQKTGI